MIIDTKLLATDARRPGENQATIFIDPSDQLLIKKTDGTVSSPISSEAIKNELEQLSGTERLDVSSVKDATKLEETTSAFKLSTDELEIEIAKELLFYSELPLVLPSSGSISTAGIITLTTALPSSVAAGVHITKCFLYLPANAINATSPAGFYYAEMTTTTSGQIYSNTWQFGVATEPTTKTNFATITGGEYTQTVWVDGGAGDVVVMDLTIPANAMGNFGSITIDAGIETSASPVGGQKDVSIVYSGNMVLSNALTTNRASGMSYIIKNQRYNRQVFLPTAFPSNSANFFPYRSVDTRNPTKVQLVVNMREAAGFIVLHYFTVKVTNR